MAEGLRVSIQGVVEGTGLLGRKAVDAFGQSGRSLGGAISGLFGGPKRRKLCGVGRSACQAAIGRSRTAVVV